jgi:single-stranded DNA-binding protein
VKKQKNKVELTGRLTREPKLLHVSKKRPVCEMRLAVDNGRYPTTFVTVSVFDGPAYSCAEFLSRGSEVQVEGELAFRERDAAGARRHEPHSIVGRVMPLHPDRPESDARPDDRPRSGGAGAATPDRQLATSAGRRGLYGDPCD